MILVVLRDREALQVLAYQFRPDQLHLAAQAIPAVLVVQEAPPAPAGQGSIERADSGSPEADTVAPAVARTAELVAARTVVVVQARTEVCTDAGCKVVAADNYR